MSSLRNVLSNRYLLSKSQSDPKELFDRYEKLVTGFMGTAEVYEGDVIWAGNLLELPNDSTLTDSSEKNILRNSRDAARKLAVFPSMSFKLLAGPAHSFFMSLLENYDMPLQIQKEAEKAVQYFFKSRINKPNWKIVYQPQPLLEYYRKYRDTQLKFVELGKIALSRGKEKSQSVEDEIRVGSFRVIQLGTFPEKDVQKFLQDLAKAESLLRSAGFGQVCYGDVQITNKLMSNEGNMAFYMPTKDDMYVRLDNARHLEHTVHSLCHELGHRYEHKFMGSSKEVVLNRLYNSMANNSLSLEDVKPERGEVLQIKKETWIVSGVKYGRGDSIKVLLQNKEEPKVTASISLEGYVSVTGKTIAYDPSKLHFVTPYSKKSIRENFAELFSYYAQGKLQGANKDAFLAVVK